MINKNILIFCTIYGPPRDPHTPFRIYLIFMCVNKFHSHPFHVSPNWAGQKGHSILEKETKASEVGDGKRYGTARSLTWNSNPKPFRFWIDCVVWASCVSIPIKLSCIIVRIEMLIDFIIMIWMTFQSWVSAGSGGWLLITPLSDFEIKITQKRFFLPQTASG